MTELLDVAPFFLISRLFRLAELLTLRQRESLLCRETFGVTQDSEPIEQTSKPLRVNPERDPIAGSG
jgi:hypothetical protein